MEVFVELFDGSFYAVLGCFMNLFWMVDRRQGAGK